MEKIIILGSGRSGTTWIQDCIARANGLSTAFEPLHPDISEVAAKYAYRHLDEHANGDDLLEYLERGPLSTREKLWVWYRLPPSKLSILSRDRKGYRSFKSISRGYRQLLKNYATLRQSNRGTGIVYKFIRAHFIVAWLQKNFSVKIVYIIRNPMHVIASQYTRGQSWNPDDRMVLIKKNLSLVADHADIIRNYEARETSVIEKLATIWAMENGYAISRCQELGIPIFTYERLKSGSFNEWRKLGGALELRRLPDLEMRVAPSLMALPMQEPPKLDAGQMEQIKRTIDLYSASKNTSCLNKFYPGLI